MSSSEDLPAGLRAFADDDVALLPAGIAEQERAQLLALLIERGDTTRLDRLAASPDKALAKAARRALHVLRTRGAKVASAPRVFQAQGPYAEAVVPSYASIIDGRGERVVWYVEAVDAGFAVFEAELSETSGVLSLTGVDLSRKAWRDQVAHMRRRERAIVGELPGWHARVLIERAYRAMLVDGRSPPESFARLHLRVQATPEELAAPHPARALASLNASVGEGAIGDGELAALLEREELQLLVPPREAVSALDLAIGEVVTSRLVLGPQQKLAQLEAAIVRIADDSLNAPLRARIAERLLETALLVASRQPDAAGRAAARCCVVAADRALDASVAAHAHPTLIAMFRRLVPAELMLRLAETGDAG